MTPVAVRALACVLAGLVLAGCASINFNREELAFLVEDERARYNLQAGLVNRACAAGALSFEECKASVDNATEAVAEYQKIRERILKRESIDGAVILKWLALIGGAVGRAYGIPIPALSAREGVRPGLSPPPLPLMR